MSAPTFRAVVVLATVLAAASTQAHFIWLGPVQIVEGRRTVPVYFSEDASADDPALLNRLQGLEVFEVEPGKAPVKLEVQLAADALTASSATSDGSVFVTTRDLGVFNRGDSVFRLKYYAKTGPAAGHENWTGIDCGQLLALDVVPAFKDGRLQVTVRWNGRPVAGAEVTATGPGIDSFQGTTDAQGQASFQVGDAGTYSIRARHIQEEAGEFEGQKYPAVRHYSTVALHVGGKGSPAAAAPQLPALATPVTSFGGATAGDYLYIYGGHSGGAHSYSEKEQGRTLLRTSLKGGRDWETVAEGPALQGLALVSHGGKLYRLGGFTAKNAAGEENHLVSQADVARLDPATGRWEELPSLPEPRSSFDAAVLGDDVYVIGGWQLRGQEESVWHTTAWKLNLAASKPQWEPVPSAPFQRRALAVAAFNGRLYAIGGMQQEGGPSTRVDVFDPKTGAWSQGPSLVGEKGMTGFGCSAFATGGQLYCSTIDGDLQRLSDKGDAWEVVAKLPTARFFHRMLPLDEGRLVIVGGASMAVGKFAEVEIVDVR